METQVECLRLEGRRAVVQPEGPVARVSAKAVPRPAGRGDSGDPPGCGCLLRPESL